MAGQSTALSWQRGDGARGSTWPAFLPSFLPQQSVLGLLSARWSLTPEVCDAPPRVLTPVPRAGGRQAASTWAFQGGWPAPQVLLALMDRAWASLPSPEVTALQLPPQHP